MGFCVRYDVSHSAYLKYRTRRNYPNLVSVQVQPNAPFKRTISEKIDGNDEYLLNVDCALDWWCAICSRFISNSF